MGFFDAIKKSATDAARKYKEDRANLRERIREMPLNDACYLLIDELERARRRSIPMFLSVTECTKWRINIEENVDELLRAFESIYDYAQIHRNNLALNMSQWIGEKLYEDNSYLICTKEDADGKRRHRPRNSIY